MRLRDREDRGFPSPLLLSYTSSSLLPPPPCRSRYRWQGDADTRQSLPLSDEHLLPPSRLTLLFHVCLTSLPVLFLCHISFCLSRFVSVDRPYLLSLWVSFVPLPPWPGWLHFCLSVFYLTWRFSLPFLQSFLLSPFLRLIGSSVRLRDRQLLLWCGQVIRYNR